MEFLPKAAFQQLGRSITFESDFRGTRAAERRGMSPKPRGIPTFDRLSSTAGSQSKFTLDPKSRCTVIEGLEVGRSSRCDKFAGLYPLLLDFEVFEDEEEKERGRGREREEGFDRRWWAKQSRGLFHTSS